ncbi:MAG TPA: glycogen debranching N-terminal domain-containing protein [Bryobacteraceae bacterium]|nr:glycogen debranching N-terminal domain-containing protein [Bryobacteraceae bacterium]
MSRNRTVLATARDGFIHGDAQQGLFVSQTRILSRYRYRVNGNSPQPVGVSNLEEHSQIAYYVIESPNADRDLFRGALGPGGQAATEPIELRLSRFAGDGLEEEVELRNHTLRPVDLRLELEIDADFADATEIDGDRKQHGQIDRKWLASVDCAELAWTYTAAHEYQHQGHEGKATLRRGVKVVFLHCVPPPVFDPDRHCVTFAVSLLPHSAWRCSVVISAEIEGREYHPAQPGGGFRKPAVYQKESDRFFAGSAEVQLGTPDLAFNVRRTLEQARRDLLALRLFDLDHADGGWTVAAGLPVYIALFGRDNLTTSWQASMLTERMMRGTLAELAATQAKSEDDWRDAQPGRFVHQMETGPGATLMYNPNARYYGSITGPGFYPVVLSNLWHWTGDRDLVRSFLDPALQGIVWLDRYAKTDDGFYAYQTRSEQGVKNQAWKDSYDAIVYPDGRQVKDPIAPAEFQAFAFASKVRLSELTWWLGERDTSKRLFDDAMTLRDRFNDRFWMADEGCFGMGLDASGELIRSVGSETGHALAAGIVHRDRVERAVERLFRPDLFSGWGIRTLSSRHPAFNPFSYHRGSVWPAEQAAFCMGLMRYGLHHRLSQLAKAQFEAAELFEFYRLPELFSGHQRDDDHPIPALYPHADSPQAWSCSAVWCMLQAMLGIFPYAPLGILFVDPHLPEWLPDIQLKNLHVGAAVVDLEFQRKDNGDTSYRVAGLRGKLHVIRQPSPWSLTTDFSERVVDAITSALPRR